MNHGVFRGGVNLGVTLNSGVYLEFNYKEIIFNHDFAKALFPEKFPTYSPAHEHYTEPDSIFEWQYHLQQAVISEDPVGYMYKAVLNA